MKWFLRTMPLHLRTARIVREISNRTAHMDAAPLALRSVTLDLVSPIFRDQAFPRFKGDGSVPHVQHVTFNLKNSPRARLRQRYRFTSLIRNSPLPYDYHMTLGIVLP